LQKLAKSFQLRITAVSICDITHTVQRICSLLFMFHEPPVQSSRSAWFTDIVWKTFSGLDQVGFCSSYTPTCQCSGLFILLFFILI